MNVWEGTLTKTHISIVCLNRTESLALHMLTLRWEWQVGGQAWRGTERVVRAGGGSPGRALVCKEGALGQTTPWEVRPLRNRPGWILSFSGEWFGIRGQSKGGRQPKPGLSPQSLLHILLKGAPHLYYLPVPKEPALGEGNGTPLQYSCLENPMDGGAWWAAVHGVAKSRTQLSDFTFTFHFHALEKEMATHSSVLAWRIPGRGEPGRLPSMGSHRVGHDWSDLAAVYESSKSSTLHQHLVLLVF